MPRNLSSRALKIWARLGQWYGSRLAESYGPTPPEDWAELIDRTDDDRLDSALLAVRRETPIHPPTLGQLENALPKKQVVASGAPTKVQQLAELMLRKHNKDLCRHQFAKPWTYFGPPVEFPIPNTKPALSVTLPDPRGVTVSECEACHKPSYRVLLVDSIGEGVAA
jgi:hypothetical protein